MSNDFYCDEVLSGHTVVKKVIETTNVLAYHHTRPYYPVHVVVIPKKHLSSLIELEKKDNEILLELLDVVKKVSGQITSEYGACRVLTNLGAYQDSKHLHWHVAFGEALKAT